MAITRPKSKSTVVQQEDAFIAGAPDAQKPAVAGFRRGNKQQISLTIAPQLLKRLDKAAKRMGQTRASLINMAIFRMLEE